MSALCDIDITDLLAATPSLCDSIPAGDTRIKHASLDLTIGNIFLPETAPTDLGSIEKPRQKIALSQGQTALIETAESVRLPPDIVAVGFPPASVTINGLLMTNPGLVDPSYEGPLRCTVINMGLTPYTLKAGDRILRLVLYRLSRTPANTGRVSSAPITEELLSGLCQDFMSIRKKTETEVKIQIEKAQFRTPIITAIIALILSVGGTVFTNYFQIGKSKDETITALTARVNELENDKIKQLQDYIDKLSKASAAGKGDH